MHTEIFKYNQHSSFVFYVYMILRMTVLEKLTTLSGMGMAPEWECFSWVQQGSCTVGSRDFTEAKELHLVGEETGQNN